jgi:hypothetical protein
MCRSAVVSAMAGAPGQSLTGGIADAAFERSAGSPRLYRPLQASRRWVALHPGGHPSAPVVPLPLATLP